MADRIKVVYIAGTGKTGSTLLGKLLGQVEGFVDVGELVNIDAQFDQNQKCGCGAAVGNCRFWGEVLNKGIGGIDKLERKPWRRLKTRYLPALFLPGARRFLTRHFHQLYRLHQAVHDIGKARVVVDSSKSAFYGAVLALFPGVDVYTVHLVRDVRASEGSMYRLKQEGSTKFGGRSTWWNSVRWMIVNLLTEWAAKRVRSPYRLVRYEDLTSDPKKTLSDILEFLSEGQSKLTFIEGHTAILGKTHTVAGSAVRFKESPIELRLDERWRSSLPERNRAVVDGLTRRFRQRYGY
jgi:Sulfotransferase family